MGGGWVFTCRFLCVDLYITVFITDACVHMGLRCLTLLFAPMKTKKLETSSIPYILKIVPVSHCMLAMFLLRAKLQTECLAGVN